MFFAQPGRPTNFSFYDPLFAKGIKIYIYVCIYIPTSKLPNKTILTVRLLPGSSAKEHFWKLPSGLGFLLTLASDCHRSMWVGDKAKPSQGAVKTRLLLFFFYYFPLFHLSSQGVLAESCVRGARCLRIHAHHAQSCCTAQSLSLPHASVLNCPQNVWATNALKRPSRSELTEICELVSRGWVSSPDGSAIMTSSP